MTKSASKRREDIGLSPYEIVFRGEKKTEETSMYVFDFNESYVHDFEIVDFEDLKPLKESKSMTWLDVTGLDDVDLMKQFSELFGIDKNIIADIMNPSIRPKVQEFENGLFITLKMIQIDNQRLSIENLSLIVMNNFLISFQEDDVDVFDPVRDRIKSHKTKIRTGGSDYLAFALLDVIIDNYIYIVSLLGEKIENLEDQLTNNLNKKIPNVINTYKRELNYLRRSIKPAKEMILTLVKMETEFIHRNNRVNFKELQDNINEANDLAESYREMLYDLLNIYHTTTTTRLNDIMKLLTIISVIFIPLTFIVGIYGTNFEYFPEIKWHYGYFAMWGMMIAVAAFMVWYFKKKKWF
jgi:magnesium transporter